MFYRVPPMTLNPVRITSLQVQAPSQLTTSATTPVPNGVRAAISGAGQFEAIVLFPLLFSGTAPTSRAPPSTGTNLNCDLAAAPGRTTVTPTAATLSQVQSQPHLQPAQS